MTLRTNIMTPAETLSELLENAKTLCMSCYEDNKEDFDLTAILPDEIPEDNCEVCGAECELLKVTSYD